MRQAISSCLFVLMCFAFEAVLVPPTSAASSQSGTASAQTLAQGKKLVMSNGCAGCHNAPGGATLVGGRVIGGWTAPGLTNDKRTGLGNWSAEEIADYLKTGRNSYAAAAGPMAGIVTNVTAKMSEAEVDAIAAYLKSLPGKAANIRPVAASNPAMIRGGAVYADECAACHTLRGVGQARLFPALKGSPEVQADNPTTLLRVVLQGAQSVGTEAAPTASAMPAFGKLLNDQQIADVLTYIRNDWGNAAAPVAKDAVAAARKTLQKTP